MTIFSVLAKRLEEMSHMHPAQPPQGPAPQFYPPVPPPKAKSKVGVIVAAVVGGAFLLCCGGVAIVGLASGGDKTDEPTTAVAEQEAVVPGGTEQPVAGDDKKTEPAPEKKTEKVPGIGDPVRDGKFEFTVSGIKCGVDQVGSSSFGEKAQGQFCLVTMKVKNIGKEAQLFTDGNQKAYSADGAQYEADTGAGIYANKNADVFLNEINPGNQITGIVVYDVPKDVKLVELELHDSMFSGGVKVKL